MHLASVYWRYDALLTMNLESVEKKIELSYVGTLDLGRKRPEEEVEK